MKQYLWISRLCAASLSLTTATRLDQDIIDLTPAKVLGIRATSTSPAEAGSTVLCGPENGNAVCAKGLCCSAQGNCGQGAAYCGSGCNSAFGYCGTVASSSFKPGPTGSTNVCGPDRNNTICATGYCCSTAGFCGKGEAFCSDPDCQYNFGACDSNQTPQGASTEKDPRPLLGNVSYDTDIFHCSVPDVVALTYDDGPLNQTVGVLNLLKQYNFTATFFVCGNNLGKGMIDTTAPWPNVIRRMVNEGHQVASHTWSHYNLDQLSTPQRITQITKNERAIANIIKKYPTYLRPPYSGCQDTTGCTADVRALGYHRVYFDFDTQDYLHDSPDQIQFSKDLVSTIFANATKSDDFLSIQHDISSQALNLTEYYFKTLRAKGWRGVTAGECLMDDRKNWYRMPGNGSADASPAATYTLSPNVTISSTVEVSPSPSPSSAATGDFLRRTMSSVWSFSLFLALVIWL